MKTHRTCLLLMIALVAFVGVALVGTTREARVIEWWHPWLGLAADAYFAYMAWMACKEHHGLLEKGKPKKGDTE
jgi:hypothetical protein